MAYEIVAYYQTGDSNSSYNTSKALSGIWETLEGARKALEWLDEHHKYYEKYTDRYCRYDLDISDAKSKPWYRENDKKYSNFIWLHSVSVPLDDGTLHVMDIPYHGYFEHLRELKIELVKSEEEDKNSKKYN